MSSDVERDPFGNRRKGLAIEIDHRAAHPHEGANVGQIFQPRDRRPRTEFPIRRRQIERHLEHRIAAQGVGVDPVLVAGADHQQPKANDVRQAVRDLIGRAGIDHAGGEPIRDPKTLFDLAQRQNAAVRRQEPAVELDHNRFTRNQCPRPGNGEIKSFMAGITKAEIAQIGFDNQNSTQNQAFKLYSPTSHA